MLLFRVVVLYFFVNVSIAKLCGEKQYSKDSECLQCHKDCKQCSGPNEEECIVCHDFHKICNAVVGRCVRREQCDSILECGLREFKNNKTGKCQKCHKDCLECNGDLPGNCTKCDESNSLCEIDGGQYCKQICQIFTAMTTPPKKFESPTVKSTTTLAPPIFNIYLNTLLFYGGGILVLVGVVLGGICLVMICRNYKCTKKTSSHEKKRPSESKLQLEEFEMKHFVSVQDSKILPDKTIKKQNQKIEEEPLVTIAEFHAESFVTQNVDWKKGQKIGSGGFGEISKYPYHDSNGSYYVAVKTTKKDRDGTYKEAEMMKILRGHPHIINLITTKIDDNMILVMPLRKENLSHFLKFNDKITPAQKMRYCQQIASAMSFTIFKKIVHCDLKANNVLVVDENFVQLCDFGEAQKMHSAKHVIGTITHTALEILMSNVANSESTDVWSFGVTIWEIFNDTQQNPYENMVKPITAATLASFLNNKNHLTTENWPSLDICPNLERIETEMLTCWRRTPKQRPTFDVLLKFFNSLLPEFQQRSLKQRTERSREYPF